MEFFLDPARLDVGQVYGCRLLTVKAFHIRIASRQAQQPGPTTTGPMPDFSVFEADRKGPGAQSGPDRCQPVRLAFELTYPVTQASGFFVAFGVNEFLKFAAQPSNFLPELSGFVLPGRHLTGVFQVAVDALQQRLQLFAKMLVIAGAAQPAGVAEIFQRYATLGAAHLFPYFEQLPFDTGAKTGGHLRARDRLGKIFLAVILTQVHFLNPALVEYLRDVKHRPFITAITFHG